ncbi:MAG: hypothetical protein ACREBW_05945, partial [Candidatus Micrarchaeaceae archaeon]
MSSDIALYRVSSAPENGVNGEGLLRLVGRNTLIISYNLAEGCTSIGIEKRSNDDITPLAESVPGLCLEPRDAVADQHKPMMALACYADLGRELDNTPLKDIFASASAGTLSLAFVPANEREITSAKEFLERRLSGMAIRETRSNSRQGYRGDGVSIQTELFNGSEERALLGNVLGSVNAAILNGGLAYKLFILIPEGDDRLFAYVKDRLLVLKEFNRLPGGISASVAHLRKLKTFPFDPKYAGSLVALYGNHRSVSAIPTANQRRNGSIIIGSYMKDGVADTREDVLIDKSSMNLGFMLS